MNFKNKEDLQKITSMLGFVGVLVFYITNHASFPMQMIMGGVLTTIGLLVSICTICIQKYRKAAGFMFIFFLIGAVITFGTYLDFINVNNGFNEGFLDIIMLLLFISIFIFPYRAAVKSRDTEAIKKVKKDLIKFLICIGILLLIAIIPTQ